MINQINQNFPNKISTNNRNINDQNSFNLSIINNTRIFKDSKKNSNNGLDAFINYTNSCFYSRENNNMNKINNNRSKINFNKSFEISSNVKNKISEKESHNKEPFTEIKLNTINEHIIQNKDNNKMNRKNSDNTKKENNSQSIKFKKADNLLDVDSENEINKSILNKNIDDNKIDIDPERNIKNSSKKNKNKRKRKVDISKMESEELLTETDTVNKFFKKEFKRKPKIKTKKREHTNLKNTINFDVRRLCQILPNDINYQIDQKNNLYLLNYEKITKIEYFRLFINNCKNANEQRIKNNLNSKKDIKINLNDKYSNENNNDIENSNYVLDKHEIKRNKLASDIIYYTCKPGTHELKNYDIENTILYLILGENYNNLILNLRGHIVKPCKGNLIFRILPGEYAIILENKGTEDIKLKIRYEYYSSI